MGDLLKPQQEKFVDALVSGSNQTNAAIAAGYDPNRARITACELVTKSNIQRRIQERIRDANLETDEVIGTLASQMRSDICDFMDENGQITPETIRNSGQSHLIKKLKVTKKIMFSDGDMAIGEEIKHEIELHDAQAAASKLAQIYVLERKIGAKEASTVDNGLQMFHEKMVKYAEAKGKPIPTLDESKLTYESADLGAIG